MLRVHQRNLARFNRLDFAMDGAKLEMKTCTGITCMKNALLYG